MKHNSVILHTLQEQVCYVSVVVRSYLASASSKEAFATIKSYSRVTGRRESVLSATVKSHTVKDTLNWAAKYVILGL